MALYNEEQARKIICEIGKRVYSKGFVAANDGNLSCRIDNDTIIVTPTGVSKGFMKPEDMVKMHLDGTIDGDNKPSSEVKMHIRAYKENKDINGIVHVHPPISTGFSLLGIDIDKPVVAEGILVTGNIPIAKYAEPGTEEVPSSIAPFLKDYNGALLERHGAITWGKDLVQAEYRMEAIEHQMKIYFYGLMLSKLLDVPMQHFTHDELENLVKIRERLGVMTGGFPKI